MTKRISLAGLSLGPMLWGAWAAVVAGAALVCAVGVATSVAAESAAPSASDLYAAIGNEDVSRDALDTMVGGMVQAGDRSPVAPLTQRLQTETNSDAQVRICQVLGRFRDPYPVPLLIALMQQNDARDAMFTGQLISALDAIGDARARDPLCEEMCHGHDKYNRNAAQEALFSNQWRACECEKPNAAAAQQQVPRAQNPAPVSAPHPSGANAAPAARLQPESAPHKK